jgi:hypothetical protein
MIPTLVLSVILLYLPAQAGGQPPSQLGPKSAAKVEAAMSSDEALAKYNELKAKAPRTVAGQSKLAMWCEDHGLKAESFVHYAEVVRLDPRREAAWRKLGFKKYGNRWMTDAQNAELEEQKKAERIWLPQLKKIHKDIHGSYGARKRDQALAAFEAIADPKAIPSLYREFGGSETDQVLLIQALDRIETPMATRVLAMLAVYGRTSEVRRRATEILRGRPSQDYLELLVGLMVDTLKYEVKPVGGPGLPGVLFVEGERFNVARFYAPPPPPNIAPRPGDLISYDQLGMPVITRPLAALGGPKGVPGSKTLVYQDEAAARFSETEMIMEAQKGAAIAESQLEGDVAQIKAVNDDRRHFNELVISVASYATGKSIGPEPKDWRKAIDGEGAEKPYRKEPSKVAAKPTVNELVPLAYQPTFAQLGFMTKVYVDT